MQVLKATALRLTGQKSQPILLPRTNFSPLTSLYICYTAFRSICYNLEMDRRFNPTEKMKRRTRELANPEYTADLFKAAPGGDCISHSSSPAPSRSRSS